MLLLDKQQAQSSFGSTFQKFHLTNETFQKFLDNPF